MVYDDAGATADRTIEVGATGIDGLGVGSASSLVTVDDAVAGLRRMLGYGSDALTIADLTRRVEIEGGLGDDSVDATYIGGAATDGLPSVATDAVEIVDFAHDATGTTTTNQWMLDGASFWGTLATDPTGADDFTHQLVHALGATQFVVRLDDIDAGGDANQVYVKTLDIPTVLDGGGGDDRFRIGFDGKTFDQLRAALTIDTGAGNDVVEINDSDRPQTPETVGFVIEGQRVVRSGAAGVGVGELTLQTVPEVLNFFGVAGSGVAVNYDIEVLDTVAETHVHIDGAGQDRVTVTGAADLGTYVYGGAGDELVIDYSASTAPVDATLSTTPDDLQLLADAGGTQIGPVYFSGLETTRAILTDFNDRFTYDTELDSNTLIVEGRGGDSKASSA
ncbi:MAG: hypothetical protein AAGG08_16005, partial [Actinomycetota bacterium]